MARITVEDCLEKIPNRFQLVLAATYRARMLSQGHAPRIESRNKPAVTALREIAEGKVGLECSRRFLVELFPGRSPQRAPRQRCFFLPQSLLMRSRATFKA